jgi:hypothetical protein
VSYVLITNETLGIVHPLLLPILLLEILQLETWVKY